MSVTSDNKTGKMSQKDKLKSSFFLTPIADFLILLILYTIQTLFLSGCNLKWEIFWTGLVKMSHIQYN